MQAMRQLDLFNHPRIGSCARSSVQLTALRQLPPGPPLSIPVTLRDRLRAFLRWVVS